MVSHVIVGFSRFRQRQVVGYEIDANHQLNPIKWFLKWDGFEAIRNVNFQLVPVFTDQLSLGVTERDDPPIQHHWSISIPIFDDDINTFLWDYLTLWNYLSLWDYITLWEYIHEYISMFYQ